MSYLAAVEHAAIQKEKIPDTEGAIETLWQDNKVLLTNGYGEKYEATFKRIEDYIDIILSHKEGPVGFITLKFEGGGKYSIVNDTKLNPHPTITKTPGHGIAVKEDFRKRGLGSALLSLGIGIAQKDFKSRNKPSTFEIWATDITESGFGCYNNFGFKIKEGMKVSEGVYSKEDGVPEIRFLRNKASLWGRLKKRLGI